MLGRKKRRVKGGALRPGPSCLIHHVQELELRQPEQAPAATQRGERQDRKAGGAREFLSSKRTDVVHPTKNLAQ